MVSDFWLNFAGGFSSFLGLPPEGTLLLLGFCLAVGCAIGMAQFSRNSQFSVIIFFLSFVFEALIGMVDWVVVIIPLILIAGLMFFMKNQGGRQ